MDIQVTKSASAKIVMDRDSTDAIAKTVVLTATIEGEGNEISDVAQATIYMLLLREAERIAQIAAVDARDQVNAVSEAARIAKAPRNRSIVQVMAGNKDPESARVHRGSVMIGGEVSTIVDGVEKRQRVAPKMVHASTAATKPAKG